MQAASLIFVGQLATELQINVSSVQAVIQLLEQGNTIPFIARYRKEATGNLNEVQIKAIQERLAYLVEIEERRQTILSSIESQGKLTDPLRQQILECQIKTVLEDLYLPYKPKRRTRAMIAREKGLEQLAVLILSQPLTGDPIQAAESFIAIEKGVATVEEALNGAKDIVAEKIAEDVTIRSFVREVFAKEGVVIAKVRPDKAQQVTKFNQYYDFKESVRTIPSHRYLAIRRGEKEDILDYSIEIEQETMLPHLNRLASLNSKSPFSSYLQEAIEDAYQRLICPSVETDIRLDLKLMSDREAVNVFADNLRHLLLASPLGGYVVIGIDPGLRTGCKCAIVDQTGKYLENTTLYLTQGDHSIQKAKQELETLIRKYQPYAIAIGNGTAGRETELFVRQLLKERQLIDVLVVAVNESGASVYSASDVAREEFPSLDLTIRGAISIARRLQDPLAELVKVDPKSIGVGQYQHDVHQPLLQEQLQYVVESCVNQVGVDLNTASASLLSYVAGIGSSLAQKIVKHREAQGAFNNRHQLREVAGFGPKTFEQAAGFLRIRQGSHPLDASAVHPERYSLVEQIAQDLNISLNHLISRTDLISSIDVKHYVSQTVGEFTLKDIIQELKKPGRDPRTQFEPARFRDDIISVEDLKPGMALEGIITNVTAFGAFVDIGVHQDGLIHLSELSNRYIRHPNEVVKTGDRVQVKVLEIDTARRRISLSAKTQSTTTGISSSQAVKQTAKVKPPAKGFQSTLDAFL
jgi:protein Tex